MSLGQLKELAGSVGDKVHLTAVQLHLLTLFYLAAQLVRTVLERVAMDEAGCGEEEG